MECMRQYISELLDFIADMHTLTKLKVSPLPHVSATMCMVFLLHFFFQPLASFAPPPIFLLLYICFSEPYEGLLSAAAWGHFWGKSESGLGTSRRHGNQQRQSPWQQSCGAVSPLAVPSSIYHATRVRITKTTDESMTAMGNVTFSERYILISCCIQSERVLIWKM